MRNNLGFLINLCGEMAVHAETIIRGDKCYWMSYDIGLAGGQSGEGNDGGPLQDQVDA